MNDKELITRLGEDTGSPEQAAELLPIIQQLQEWEMPVPMAHETARLIEALQRSLKPRLNSTISHRLHLGWLVLYSQLRVVQYEIWAASSLVMGLGFLVTLAYGLTSAQEATLPFVLLAPIAAAAGVAFLYGPAVDPALEIELTTPVSPRQVLVARLVLIFGFNLLLGMTGSAILSIVRNDVTFWPLVSAWLAPMTFLASLAFLLITLTLDSGASLLACLVLWIFQNVRLIIDPNRLPFTLPDLTATTTRPWLWLLTIVLSGVALWIGGGEEHWLRKRA
jgi:hypothetical protein